MLRIGAPRFKQRFGLCLRGVHNLVAALLRFAAAVGVQREADTLGGSALPAEAEMAPPCSVVVPNVVIRSVVAVVRFNKFIFHSELA